jgi:hypothetical protein
MSDRAARERFANLVERFRERGRRFKNCPPLSQAELDEKYRDLHRRRREGTYDEDSFDGDILYYMYNDEETLNRLCSDTRMRRVWVALSRVPDATAVRFLLEVLTSAKAADEADSKLKSYTDEIETAREMCTAVKKLLTSIQKARREGYFLGTAIEFDKMGELFPHGSPLTELPLLGPQLDDEPIRVGVSPLDDSCVSWLEWLGGYLDDEIREKTESRDQIRMGVSHKNNAAPHVEIFRELVRASKKAFGQPSYEIVANLASTILGRDIDIDPEAVRSAVRKRPIRS